MKKLNLLIMLFSLIGYPLTPVYPQFIWEQLPGLDGADSEVLAANSQGDLFVGTYTAGIFKSTDNGMTWLEKNNGLTTANNVISLAISDNGDIFAGTFNTGIFRSTDNGESWVQINNGLTLLNVRAIVFNDNGHIFLSSAPTPFQGGVFRSTDNGDNWTLVNVGLPFGAIFTVAIDSSNNVYAGSGFSAGVYISTNNGESWAATGLTNATAMSLTIDKPNNIIYVGTYTDILKSTDSGQSWSNTGALGNIWALTTNTVGDIFVGTWAGSIYRSSDNGNSWVNLKNELTIVQDILINQDNHIFAATRAGVFSSTDSGVTWISRSSGIDYQHIRSIHIAANGYIFAGSDMLNRSIDNGTNWSYVKGGRGNSYYSSIVTNDQGDIFAGSGGGSGGYWIYRSTDNGDSWIRINNGIADSSIWTITLDSLDNIFIGTNAGVYKSTDNGDTWELKNTGLGTNVRVIVVKNNKLFAGRYPSGLFRSTDGGNNWVSIMNGITGTNWLSIAIDSSGNIYTGSASGGSGIYKSTNDGDSWFKADSGITAGLNISTLVAEGNDVFAGTRTGGVFHSTDNGQYWTSMNEGFSEINEIFSLEVSNNYIYAGTKGLWRRQLYEVAPVPPSNLIAVADTFVVDLYWDDNSNNELGFKIERKDDSLHLPAPWNLIDSVGANVTTFKDTGLTPNTTYSYRIYAYNEFGSSAYSDSVETTTTIPVELLSFSATVSGNTVNLNWSTATEINNQGFEIQRASLSASPGHGNWEAIGFAPGFGTTTEPKSYSFIDEKVSTGIYQYRLKQKDYDGSYEYSDVVEIEVSNPVEFSLEQNYPNPFNPTTKINYSIAYAGNIQLVVYNSLGEEISLLVNETQHPGRYTIEFNASSLSSGIYFYKLIAGDFVSIRKMIFMK